MLPALILAAVLLALGASALAAVVQRGIVSFALAFYVLTLGELVLLTELLSFVHGVRIVGYLVAETIVAAAALAFWNAQGRPRPHLPRFDVLGVARRHPALTLLAVVVVASLAYEAFLVLTVPPNTWDAMTYHLPRAVAWSQAHAVGYYDAHTTRENMLPPNGELQILWTFVLLGGDRLASAPQFVAQLALLAAVFGCARRLGFPRANATFAALVFATLTEVALQSTSTQNDLVTAAPIVAAAYFVLGRTRVDLVLAGIAIGLAVGTKFTALIAVPLVVLLALAVLPRRRIAYLAATTAAGILIFGAYGYVLNVVHAGTPLGDSPEAAAFSPVVTGKGTASSFARLYWDLVDFSGLQVDPLFLEWVRENGQSLFEALGVDTNPRESTATPFAFTPNTNADEDRSFFGPLGILLVAPLSLAFMIAFALRRVSRAHLALALALPLFVLAVAFTHRYNAWIGRFLTLPIALVMPLAAVVYWRRIAAAVVIAVGAVTLFAAHGENLNKLPDNAVWKESRVEAMTVKQGDLRPTLHWLDAQVPRNAPLGIRLGSDDWTYPLYGARLQRRLVPLRSLAEADGVDYVVVGAGLRLRPTPGWREVRFANGWRILRRV